MIAVNINVDLTGTAGDVARTVALLAGPTIALVAVYFSRRSSDSAAKSAANSKRSADTAAEALRRSGCQEHDRLAPNRPGPLDATWKSDVPPSGAYLATVKFQRDYRVRVIKRYRVPETGQVRTSEITDLPVVLRAEQPYLFAVGPKGGRERLKSTEIEFLFWPPTASDDVELWECPCDRPHNAGNGHWSFVVPVYRQPPPQVRVATLQT